MHESNTIISQRVILESKLEGQLFAEFEMIAKKRHKCECGIATLERNRERNRYHDVVPYDDNRVLLVPSKVNPDGYINASHIRVGCHYRSIGWKLFMLFLTL